MTQKGQGAAEGLRYTLLWMCDVWECVVDLYYGSTEYAICDPILYFDGLFMGSFDLEAIFMILS